MAQSNLTGCYSVGCVIGAEELTETSGVWYKARFYRDGHFLCATVYSVAAGEPRIIQLQVDLRPIARAILRAHSTLHASEIAKASLGSSRANADVVGWSLGKLWRGAKKAAAKIGRSKLVRGVTGAVMKVASNKAFQVVMPAAALAAHTTSKALGGKGAFKGALGAAVNLGTGAVLSSIPGGALSKGLSASVLTSRISQNAIGAYATANQAVAQLEAGRKVMQTATSAASTIRRGTTLARKVTNQSARTAAAVSRAGATMNAKTKAAVVARTRSSTRKAAPVIAKAAAVARTLQRPIVKKALVGTRVQAGKAEALLRNVKNAAATGNLDAQKSAVIVDLVARNRARIQAMAQASAGGLPGILITKDGKLQRGRFRVQAKTTATGVLYQGAGSPSERAPFTSVSGDLPLDGVRMTTRGAGSYDVGPYEVGCGSTCGCPPSAAPL